MKNQRGVTLIELLVIIVIMGAIFVPISMMLIYSLETEKEVSIKNDIQREARFIMEYVTEKMRDSNIYWDTIDPEPVNKTRILYSFEDIGLPNKILHYTKNEDGTGIMSIEGMDVSENVKEFTVTENKSKTMINIKLIIEKSGYELKLQSDIIHPDSPRYYEKT